MSKSILVLTLILFVCALSTNAFGQGVVVNESQADETFRVTLIGTGVPPVDPNRMGSAVLVEAGKHKLLFDVGRGASINIKRHGLNLASVTRVFLTHLHGDHVTGLPDFWLSSYHRNNGKRAEPLPITGPVGVAYMVSNLEVAYRDVMKSWLSYAKPGFDVTEISAEGAVFEEDDLRVTAFKVNHGTDPAYGYKIDYKGRSTVISGDTGYSENLIQYSKGTDLLIHGIFDFEPTDSNEITISKATLERLKVVHTVPEDAAKVFNAVAPKMAVAYHLSPALDSERLNKKITGIYSGVFIIGEDLMTFEIGDGVRLVQGAQ